MIENIILMIEAQSARRLPAFHIEINGIEHPHQQQILKVDGFCWYLECTVSTEILTASNSICVIMRDKQDQDNIDPNTGSYVDHYISVKQIRIQDIDADALLYKKSHVEHSMPQEWVDRMCEAGHEILPRYPGSDLHINGRMTFEFSLPFWLDKTLCLDATVPKKHQNQT